MGYIATVGDFSYKVDVGSAKFYSSINSGYNKKTANGVYLAFILNYCNNGKKEVLLDNTMFKLIDDSNNEYSISVDGTIAMQMQYKDEIFKRQCHPQIPMFGALVFEVPEMKSYNLKLIESYFSGNTGIIRINP